MAIGWHFLYEGLWKIDSRRPGSENRPFSAEGYLANSTGPFSEHFRGMVGDPEGTTRLDPLACYERWQGIIAEYDRRYGLTQQQKDDAANKLEQLHRERQRAFGLLLSLPADLAVELNESQYSDNIRLRFENANVVLSDKATVHVDTEDESWIITDTATGSRCVIRSEGDALNVYDYSPSSVQWKLDEYLGWMNQIQQAETSELAFEKERAEPIRQEKVWGRRGELLAEFDRWETSLVNSIRDSLSEQQQSIDELGWLAKKLNLPFALTWPEKQIDQVNLVTMCGLSLCGIGLLFGFLSRLSALGAAVFVGMFYLCNPAPPLGVNAPGDLGHYMYVNKELIECLAALVLATIPTGRWLGLDAIIHGLIGKRLAATFTRKDRA